MKFSIIIPSYNYAHFIQECLNSVVVQTYEDWECLIIDNASTDDTEAICHPFLNDVRIKYLRLEENKGPSVARNVGLRIAQGDYVLFLDADDLIEFEKLASCTDIISGSSPDLIFTDYSFFSANATLLTNTHTFSDDFNAGLISAGDISEKLIHGNIFAISCIVTSKKILEEVAYFDDNINYNEDWDLWLRISIKQVKFYYDSNKDTHTLIRNHQNSHSKDLFSMYAAGLYVCKKNYGLLNEAGKRVFDKKINGHRYTIKTMLTAFYFNDKIKFNSALATLDKCAILSNEFFSYRKSKWLLPAFLVPVFTLILKCNYILKR